MGLSLAAQPAQWVMAARSEVPCCDVMVAHLRVWQLSIDNPPRDGRPYSTAVHIS